MEVLTPAVRAAPVLQTKASYVHPFLAQSSRHNTGLTHTTQLPPMPATHHHPGTSPSPSHVPLSDKGRPTFGVNLSEQMSRDDADVPPILVKCCEAIEKYGLTTQGVYRIGGTHSKVLKLKERLDRGVYCSVHRGMCSVPLGLMTLDIGR